MNFDQTQEFVKEFKKFNKKWRSLSEDFEVFKNAVTTIYIDTNRSSALHVRETFFATKKAAVLRSITESKEVIKVRLDCRDLNKDMLRVIFIRIGNDILLIELYSKNEKDREDVGRINKYLKIIDI